MRTQEKFNWLMTHFFAETVSMRKKVFEEMSDKQTMFCVCGKLATGLHEDHCRKFNKKVNTETVKRLEHLIKDNANK